MGDAVRGLVSYLKPDICSRNASITDPVEICGNVLCIIILVELCHRKASMTFLTRICDLLVAMNRLGLSMSGDTTHTLC